MRASFLVFAALAFAVPASAAPPPKNPFVLKAGQQLIFSATVADGRLTIGAPRLVKLGEVGPAEGEIAVGLTPKDKELYSQVVVTEKTSAPVGFIATGHIGEIVIDEREIHGKTGETFQQRIGGVSWTVELHDFVLAAGK